MTQKLPIVRLDSVGKVYGTTSALDETSLTVREGEFLSLLGPSGSGKTTLLNIIAGMASPSYGRVFIGEQDVTSVPPEKRNIGMVFQNYALMPHMTIFDNIAFPLVVRRVPKAEIKRRVAEVLDVVRLPDVAGRKPRELSGGQQQRISIARCIVYNPRVILMDEPLGALDKKLRMQMQLEIKALQTKLGITMIYVTHDQEEAMNMSDRIMLMSDGRVRQIGSPEDIYHRPNSIFAADFIGSSSLLKAEVVECDETLQLRLGGGVHCRAPLAPVPVGTRGRLLLRPEALTLTSSEPAVNPDRNVIKLEIVHATATGGMLNYYGTFGENEQVIVHELPGRGLGQAAAGSSCYATWAIADGLFIID